jgi:hypothetical protein
MKLAPSRLGLQMILTGWVGLVAGGGRVSWRVGVPGAAFGVSFLAIGAASARRAASAAKGTGVQPSAHEGGDARKSCRLGGLTVARRFATVRLSSLSSHLAPRSDRRCDQ